MFLILLSLLGGLVFLTIGAEGLIRGSVAMGKNFKVSPLLMGLTLVSFSTSSPEFFATLQATLSGSPAIAIGNIIGSNIFNLAVILGFMAILTHAVPLTSTIWKRDGLTLFAATLSLALALQFMPMLTRPVGLAFLLALGGYIWLAFKTEKASGSHNIPPEITTTPKMHLIFSAGLVAAGLIGLIIGGNLLVNASVALAKLWGLSESVVGLTIVAIGTSLPELITSLIAAQKKQHAIAIGNLIGSNIFNILGILGVTSLLRPISVAEQLPTTGWIMLGFTTLFLITARAGLKVTRTEGLLFLIGFLLYLWYLLG